MQRAGWIPCIGWRLKCFECRQSHEWQLTIWQTVFIGGEEDEDEEDDDDEEEQEYEDKDKEDDDDDNDDGDDDDRDDYAAVKSDKMWQYRRLCQGQV